MEATMKNYRENEGKPGMGLDWLAQAIEEDRMKARKEIREIKRKEREERRRREQGIW